MLNQIPADSNLPVKKKKQKQKNDTSTYIILGVSLFAMAFIGVCNPRSHQNNSLKGDAGHVGNEGISKDEFARAYSHQSQTLHQRYGESYDPAALKIAHSTLELLVHQKIMFKEAMDAGIRASEDEIVDRLKDVPNFKDKDGKFSQTVFRNYLLNSRHSGESFIAETQQAISVERFHSLVDKSVATSSKETELEYILQETKLELEFLKLEPQKISMEISAEEIANFLKEEKADSKVKSWYDSHQSQYHIEKKVHAQHILVSYKEARNASGEGAKRTKDEAKKKAQDLLKKVQEQPTEFSNIAKEFTDEPNGKETKGDLGFFTHDAMVKEFSEAAFKLKPSEISSLVETPFGFHIIKVLEVQEKKDTTLEEAKNSIAKELVRQKKGPELAEKRAQEALQLASEGKPMDSFLKENGLAWEKTGEVSINATHIPQLGSKQEILDAIQKLNKNDKIYKDLVRAGGTFYILRLVAWKDANLAQLDGAKRESLKQALQGRKQEKVYQDYEKKAVKSYEDKKLIERNPAYLALDSAEKKEPNE